MEVVGWEGRRERERLWGGGRGLVASARGWLSRLWAPTGAGVVHWRGGMAGEGVRAFGWEDRSRLGCRRRGEVVGKDAAHSIAVERISNRSLRVHRGAAVVVGRKAGGGEHSGILNVGDSCRAMGFACRAGVSLKYPSRLPSRDGDARWRSSF